ncbi:hypothetical protein [Acidisoma sp. 7E03]
MSGFKNYVRYALVALGLASVSAGMASQAHADYYWHHHHYHHREWVKNHHYPHGYYRYY